MTAPGESSVSYLCPQCQTRLTARAEDAGQRRECPQCGKQVKVPGVPNRPAGTGAGRAGGTAEAAATPRRGIANIPLICPLCGTRMYATPQQVGQTMVCPDCLESVVVPDQAPPPRKRSASSPPSTPVGPASPSVTGGDAQDDDELKLSEPVELPRHRSVSKQMSELLDEYEHDATSGGQAPSPPASPSPAAPPPAAAKRPLPGGEFAAKCPVCDTLIYATAEEIGQERTCPDCFSKVIIQAPRPKPRRVNDVVEADYDDEDFVLGAPVELDVFKPSAHEPTPKTVGEESLLRAQRELDQREPQQVDLPGAPLWTGLFNFLPDPVLISRLVASGLLLGGAISLLQVTIGLSRGNALLQFLAVGCSIATLVTELLALALLAANCLTILQETAEGGDRVSQWPESSPLEWAVESFSVGMAMFFSGLPGMLVFWATAAAGMSMGTSWIFVGISWYIFFPVALLSILESASLTSPVSKPILDSLRSETLLWVTFYLITFFLALGVAITLTLLTLSNAYPLLFALGIVWAFAAFLYFRLLGRLAWACQVRPTLRQDADENEGHTSSEGRPKT